MAGPFDNLPPEVALEQQRLTRQQQLANALMQNNQQPQGQMVSGRFVAPSFFQNLQPVANMLTGAYLSNKADEKSLALAQQLRNRNQADIQNFMGAMSPVAAQEGGIYGPDGKLTMQTTADMYGPDMTLNPAYRQVAPVEGRGPDLAKAFRIAYGSYDPALKAQAIEMLKTQKLGPDESLVRQNIFSGGTDVIMQGPPKVGQELKDAAREAKVDINKIDTWSPQEWDRVRAVESRVAAGKRPANIVNIPNFTEKTFAGGLAESQVKKFDTLQTNAEKAPDVLRSAAESKKILKSGKFFSGSPAELQLEMAKVADALGLGGTDTKEKAFNTQTLITNAASGTLDSIAGAGLGTGQGFTDKDLKFLQEAKSFRINMTDDNIRRVIDLQERAARASVDRYNQRLKTLPQQSIQQMGLTPITLPRSADEIVGNQ
jgi:hypothetical protein